MPSCHICWRGLRPKKNAAKKCFAYHRDSSEPLRLVSDFSRGYRLSRVLHHRRCSSHRLWFATPRAGYLEDVISYVRQHFTCRSFALNCRNALPSQLASRPFAPVAPSSFCCQEPFFSTKLCCGGAPKSADTHAMVQPHIHRGENTLVKIRIGTTAVIAGLRKA